MWVGSVFVLESVRVFGECEVSGIGGWVVGCLEV